MQLPAHRSATMAYQFSDLPNDLMEVVFEALPSVYQIYKCSLVCRAWHGPAWRVLERRRAAIIARSTKFQTWHEGSKPSPEQRVFTEIKAELCIVVAYGLILPPVVLHAPRLGCINAHATLLPRWRGAAPLPDRRRDAGRH